MLYSLSLTVVDHKCRFQSTFKIVSLDNQSLKIRALELKPKVSCFLFKMHVHVGEKMLKGIQEFSKIGIQPSLM